MENKQTERRALNIFIVEDDDDDYFLLKNLIKDTHEWHFELERATSFSDAMMNLTKKSYDAALIDYYLGSETGLGLIKNLRAQSVDIPLILLTGRSDPEIESEAILAGASDFLEKGQFDFPLLRRSLRYAINRQSIQKERDKALFSLQQSQKIDAIGRLAGGIAHDFNNTLTVIFAYSDILLEKLEPSSVAAEIVQELKKSAERAAGLTKQLLAFTRKQHNVAVAANMNSLLNHIEKMLQRLIGEDVVLTIKYAEKLPLIQIDIGQFEQVVLNLVLNARDALGQNGQITISTSTIPSGEQVVLTITDTGKGMSEETQSHIFEPFFTTKEVGKGTGLGLATVYGIVKQSGGTIELHSELGKGTTFNLYFPKIEEETDTSSILKIAPNHTNLHGNETILLVEDEENLLKVLKASLEHQGSFVVAASNGEEGLNLALKKANKTIDLVLSDVQMPKKSGIEMVKGLRDKYPNLKVIYMSGNPEYAFGENGFQPDAITNFIQKPVAPKIIMEQIRCFLDNQQPPTTVP